MHKPLPLCKESKTALNRSQPAPRVKRAGKPQDDAATLRQWRIFHAVHDYGGFTEAARNLHISQPAVTYSIHALEARFGLTLFEKSHHKVVVTPQGREILDRSRRLLCDALDLELTATLLNKDGNHS